MKTWVLYHPSPDGCAAAAITYGVLGSAGVNTSGSAEYVGVNSGQPLPDIKDGSAVYILDLPYPRESLVKLATRCSLLVLAHELTMQEECSGLDFCTVNGEHCTAWLTYCHFGCDNMFVKLFLRYLDDCHLGQFALARSTEFWAALQTEPYDYRRYLTLMEQYDGVDELQDAGVGILRATAQNVENMCRAARLARFRPEAANAAEKIRIEPMREAATDNIDNLRGEWLAPCANAPIHCSEVCDRLLKEHPRFHFAAYYFDHAECRQWGLRGRPGFDSSVIATAMGGSGNSFTQEYESQ